MRVSLDQLRQRVVDEIYVLTIFEVKYLSNVFYLAYNVLILILLVINYNKNCSSKIQEYGF